MTFHIISPSSKLLSMHVELFMDLQGCHGQGKKSGKLFFFQVREKSGNFNVSHGNLEKVVKVREKSGNMRIFKKVHC